MDMEIGGMVCFNMATAAGTQGCDSPGPPPPASVFNDHVPLGDVQTDQWCEALASAGAKYSVLVAKHECGFTIWPTKAESGGFV
jgi:alpha-L-fucosidase